MKLEFEAMPFEAAKQYLLEISDPEKRGRISYISAYWDGRKFVTFRIDFEDFLEGKDILGYVKLDMEQ